LIEGISDYPENRISIFNRNGIVVYEGRNYNNSDVSFKGQSKEGTQLPEGTYFYTIQIRDGGVWKYHRGFFVLRY